MEQFREFIQCDFYFYVIHNLFKHPGHFLKFKREQKPNATKTVSLVIIVQDELRSFVQKGNCK